MTTPAPAATTTSTTTRTFPLESLRRIVPELPLGWIAEQEKRANKVAKMRRYAEGEHDAKLTQQMKDMLRLKDDATELAINYCDLIVQTKVDRCVLIGVVADNDKATAEATDLYQKNRMDALQSDTHEAAVRDGDTFVIVAFDNSLQRPTFTLEEAFDGESGMLAWYKWRGSRQMEAAIKIWGEEQADGSFVTRVNVYWPNRVEKFEGATPGGLEPFARERWTMTDDDGAQAIGVPIIHFRNGGRANFGRSELADAIAPQDILNRTWYSTVMAAELTAFRIFIAKGFPMPAALTPGMIVQVNNGAPLPKDQEAELDTVEGASLEQYIRLAEFLKGEMGSISRTPSPEFGQPGAADNASGESLKQREIGLLGKAERFMTRAGNAWEDAFALAWRVQQAFGSSKPAPATYWTAKWRKAEIRSDAEVVDNALKIKDAISSRQLLRTVADVFDWGEADIEKIAQEKEQEALKNAAEMAPFMPNFNSFNNFDATSTGPDGQA